MQWSALAIAAKQRADIATKAALEAEREKDAALKELERLQRQGRTDAAQDLQINGRAVEETSPLDIITVKEEDPGAPLLLGEVVEVAPQPTPPPPPKWTVPTELKGWNYFLFVGSTAFLLVNAGFVNAVGLKATGSTNSHYTGMTTRLGIEIAMADAQGEAVDGFNILVYCFGVGVSTIALGPDKFCFSYNMAALFLLQGIILIIAATRPDDDWKKAGPNVTPTFGIPFVVVRFLMGFAMGLQNGISCGWGGAVARTTHCTGILTDIVIIGFLTPYRYSAPDMARLGFFVPFYFAFFFGGIIGASVFTEIHKSALFVPAFVAIGCSIAVSGFMAVKYQARKKAESEGRPFVDYQMPFDNKPLFPDKEAAAVQKMFDGLSAQDIEKKTLETFQKLDTDGNNELNKEEFGRAFELMGLKLSLKERDEMFAEVDVDGSGSVDLEEFRQMVKIYLDRAAGRETSAEDMYGDAHGLLAKLPKGLLSLKGRAVAQAYKMKELKKQLVNFT